MTDILALLQPIAPLISKTTLRQFSRVVFGLFAMTGRVTMLGVSRWAGKGGSYRTVQRLYYTLLPWAEIFWTIFHKCLFQPEDEYILAGDEVVVSKAGEATFGKDCIAYKLRFQIEFNFRDAKQYWGLEDFMNIEQTPVTNAANLSLFMVSLSQILLDHYHSNDPSMSVLDLKAHFRGFRYVAETIKMLPQKPDNDLLAAISCKWLD
jgi:hypothetical protein